MKHSIFDTLARAAAALLLFAGACKQEAGNGALAAPATGAGVGAAGAAGFAAAGAGAGGVAGVPATAGAGGFAGGGGIAGDAAGAGAGGFAGGAGTSAGAGGAGTSAGAGGAAGMAGAGTGGFGGASGIGGMSGVGGAGAGGGGGGGNGAPGATFAQVYAIMMTSCGGGLTGCHITGSSGRLAMPNAMAAFDALVDVDSTECDGETRVVPGDADTSLLVKVLEDTACVDRMPRGRAALSAANITTVRSWIDAGALEN